MKTMKPKPSGYSGKIQVSDQKWNPTTWSLDASFDLSENQFWLNSAFNLDQITLNKTEAARLHRALSRFLKGKRK